MPPAHRQPLCASRAQDPSTPPADTAIHFRKGSNRRRVVRRRLLGSPIDAMPCRSAPSSMAAVANPSTTSSRLGIAHGNAGAAICRSATSSALTHSPTRAQERSAEHTVWPCRRLTWAWEQGATTVLYARLFEVPCEHRAQCAPHFYRSRAPRLRCYGRASCPLPRCWLLYTLSIAIFGIVCTISIISVCDLAGRAVSFT